MNWQDSEKRVFLSRIYQLKKQRLFGQMEDEVRTALERFPSDVQFEVLLADASWQRGDKAQAQTILSSLQERGRDVADFHALQGAILVSRGAAAEALECFRKAHALRPSDFYVKRQADCLLLLKEHEQALALLQSLPEARSDYFILSALARAYEALGRVEQARECYQAILEQKPKDAVARSRLFQLKLSEKSPEEAHQEVDRLLRVPSQRDDPALLKVRAEQFWKDKRFEESAEIYRRLAELTSGQEKIFNQRFLAFSLYRSGRFPEAFELLRDLCEQSPSDPYVRNTLIAAAKKIGRTGEIAQFLRGLAARSPANRHLYGVAGKLKS